jgi:hypothetical protein
MLEQLPARDRDHRDRDRRGDAAPGQWWMSVREPACELPRPRAVDLLPADLLTTDSLTIDFLTIDFLTIDLPLAELRPAAVGPDVRQNQHALCDRAAAREVKRVASQFLTRL